MLRAENPPRPAHPLEPSLEPKHSLYQLVDICKIKNVIIQPRSLKQSINQPMTHLDDLINAQLINESTMNKPPLLKNLTKIHLKIR